MQSQTHTFMINGSPMPCLQADSGEPLQLNHGVLANHTSGSNISSSSHSTTPSMPPPCATSARQAKRGLSVLRPMPAICLPCWSSCRAGLSIWSAGLMARMWR